MSDLEDRLKNLYDRDFLSHDFRGIHFNKNTGLDEGESLRFGGYPYVGSMYETSRLKILFVGLDIGKDELWIEKGDNTYHKFDSRRKSISKTSFTNVPNSQKKYHPYNPHIAGTYALSLALLNELYGWQSSWNLLSTESSKICWKSIQEKKGDLPTEVLDYVSLVNIHKFVNFDRKRRSGNANRKWLDRNFEIQFLIKEIAIFAPDIIVFQGCSHALTSEQRKSLAANGVLIISGRHPSSWRKNKEGIAYNSIGYAKSLSEEALLKLSR